MGAGEKTCSKAHWRVFKVSQPPAMSLGKLAELVQLIFGVLAFVLGRHAGINGYSHVQKYFLDEVAV
jgi:hypothetical protein